MDWLSQEQLLLCTCVHWAFMSCACVCPRVWPPAKLCRTKCQQSSLLKTVHSQICPSFCLQQHYHDKHSSCASGIMLLINILLTQQSSGRLPYPYLALQWLPTLLLTFNPKIALCIDVPCNFTVAIFQFYIDSQRKRGIPSTSACTLGQFADGTTAVL